MNSPTSHHAPPEQAWTIHPLRDNWKRSTLLLLFLTLLGFGIYWSFQSVVVGLFSTLLLIASLHRYFLPFRYECDADEVVVTSLFYRTRKPWSDFHSYYVDANGVLLSPFTKPSRLENFRGIYIRFGRNRAEVVELIKRKVGAPPDATSLGQ